MHKPMSLFPTDDDPVDNILKISVRSFKMQSADGNSGAKLVSGNQLVNKVRELESVPYL